MLFESQHRGPGTAQRFEFGANWRRFVNTIDRTRLAEAQRSLQNALGEDTLTGLRVLDIGSGSGLFSLAAVVLGAKYVHSFDYDPVSVRCGLALKEQFAPRADWKIERGSVLDLTYMRGLGTFDLVYSWGVLHHTGDLRTALQNTAGAVSASGRLFISIYNDQGRRSQRWLRVKRLYNRLPRFLRNPYVLVVMGPRELRAALVLASRGELRAYIETWTRYKQLRGMSRWHDLIDWCGGYPFEVAKPEDIFHFYRDRGFVLQRLKTAGAGLACNEFVFTKQEL